MSTKSVSVPWFLSMFWDEIFTLIVCVFLDVIEYVFPLLMIPVAGDIIDLVGVTFCIYFFSWTGAIAFLEIIPGLDSLPLFTATWLIWYVMKRRRAQQKQREELENWR